MNVRVYVVEGCPHCEALLADLHRRRVAHVVVNLTVEPHRVEEVVRLTWQRRVPVIVDHERYAIGFRGASSEVDGEGRRSG